MGKRRKKNRDFRATRRGQARHLKSTKRKGKIHVFILGIPKENIHLPKIIKKKNTCIVDEYDYSETLKFLFQNPNIFTKSKAYVPKSGILYVPRIFSLAEAPEESYKFLKDLLYSLRYPKNKKLTLNYRNCIRIDLDAAVCNDIILLEFINAFKKCSDNNIQLQTNAIKGIELNNENVKKFIYATGTHKILKNIQVSFPNVQTYDLVIGDRKRGIAHKEVESTNLVKHIEKCLIKMDKELTSDARESFGEIIAEVIANAEEHNITDYHYSIGHFEASQNGEENIGSFQLVIFNFGESIYQRFNNPEACKNPEILADIRARSTRFLNNGFFGWFKDKRFEEETLWTLYSLQDGVSSVDSTRGNGTIKFIDQFLELSDENEDKASKLHLFSGNTHIKFDGTYKTITKYRSNGDEFKIIPFNQTGTLEDKPDQKFVTFVDNFFPGTMIYANIIIKENDVKKNENS